MSANLISGNEISASVNHETAAEAASIAAEYGIQPALAVILVGEDPASQVYVNRKAKKCVELGIRSEKIVLPADTQESELLAVIARLNADPSIHGILVQSPVPKHIDEQKVVLAIDPTKDVDCFHPMNVGRMMLGDFSGFLPCTPWGVITMLQRSGISPAGKKAVVLGRSNIVGKPMAAMLSANNELGNATVATCHSRTKDLEFYTKNADIIVAAIGIPNFLKGDQVSEGAVIIDVGINRIADSAAKNGCRLVGDVDFESVAPKASYITPVPGGVGPMTIAMLMKNTIRACKAAIARGQTK